MHDISCVDCNGHDSFFAFLFRESHNVVLSKVNVTDSRVIESDLQDVKWEYCNFTGVNFSLCNFEDVQFVDCRFHNVDFDNVNLKNVLFKNLDLRNVRLMPGVIDTTQHSKDAANSASWLTDLDWCNLRITNAVFSPKDFSMRGQIVLERPHSTSKTTIQETGLMKRGTCNYVVVGREYQSAFERFLELGRRGKGKTFHRLMEFLFPKTLVLFRELPPHPEYTRRFGRDDRFKNLFEDDKHVSIDILYLRPGVSITRDPSALSMQGTPRGYHYKKVDMADPTQRLEGLKFSLGLIGASSVFYNMLRRHLYDRVFAFQCSANITKKLLKHHTTAYESLRSKRHPSQERFIGKIMLGYGFVEAPDRFVISDHEWRWLNNFLRHEYWELEEIHLLVGAEFWDVVGPEGGSSLREILAQPNLSAGRQINMLKHVAKLAARARRNNGNDDARVGGAKLHLTIDEFTGTKRDCISLETCARE